MVQNLLTLFLLVLASISIGGGWSLLYQNKVKGHDVITTIYWSILYGIAIPSLTTAFAIGLNLNIVWSAIPIVITGLLGWLKFCGCTKDKTKLESNGQLMVIAIIALFISALLCSLSAQNIVTGGQPFRIGPDAIGNAVAAQSLASGDTIKGIRADLNTAADLHVGERISNQDLLYATPSIQLQVEGEFLAFGLRWGFSGTSGLLVQLMGLQNIWLILNGLGNLALLCTAFGVWGVLSKTDVYLSGKIFCVLSASVAPILLNGFREGGVAQAWVLPSSLALMLIIASSTPKTSHDSYALALVLAYSAVSYSDLFILQIATVVFYFTASAIFSSRDLSLKFPFKTFLVGAFLGLPFFIRFISYLPRRFVDASIGGWSMPHWTGLSESIGLLNRFNQNSPDGLQIRSSYGVISSVSLDIILIILFALSWRDKRDDQKSIFGLASLLVVYLVYFKSRYLDQATNYQYFKAFGTMLPLITIGIAVTCFNPGSNDYIQRVKKTISLLFVILMISSTVNYVVNFKQSSRYLSSDNGQNQFVEKMQLLDDRAIFSPVNLEILVLAPYTKTDWLGRRFFNRTENLSKKDKSVAVLILKSSCENWNCIQQVPNSRIIFQTRSVTAVDIGLRTTMLPKLNSNDIWAKMVSEKLEAIGGPHLTADYVPGLVEPKSKTSAEG